MLISVLFLTACLGLDTFPAKDAPLDDTGELAFADSGGPGQPLDDSGEFDGNAPPFADAGEDMEIEVGRIVELDGSGSYDPEGDPLDYAWSLVSTPQGSTASLINGARVNPELFVDQPGLYVIQLSVSDGALTGVDEVEITAFEVNNVPVANAGANQSVDVGEVVLLNGTGSTDPDGDALNFTWQMLTKPSGSLAQLSDPTSDRPTFTADLEGSYEVQLVVDDGADVSTPDTVRVTASVPSSGGGSDGCLGCASGSSRGAGAALMGLSALLLLRRRQR
ncbi:MAG: hypothetical protein H6740_25250 [Alphaproteobacteria bacterium]|nr:hypothetical protein [Alphaproteobacteria bacterium]